MADAPLRYPISPSNELSRLRAMIEEANEQRLEPGQALTWMAANAPSLPAERAA